MRGFPGSLALVTPLLTMSLFGGTGCADTPITPDQLESDGRLRPASLEQNAFRADREPRAAQAAQISAVLAAQDSGPLSDASEFVSTVGAIHLHVRADAPFGSRPVVFRWTHDDVSVLVPGVLEPSTALTKVASFPVGPEQVGHWEVDVLGTPLPGEPPPVFFHRAFEITAADMSASSADASPPGTQAETPRRSPPPSPPSPPSG